MTGPSGRDRPVRRMRPMFSERKRGHRARLLTITRRLQRELLRQGG